METSDVPEAINEEVDITEGKSAVEMDTKLKKLGITR